MVESRIFGKLRDGRQVICCSIWNKKKEHVELLNFGAAIHGIYVRGRKGITENVVLHVEKAEELEGRSYEGVVIGRCANRIAGGTFFLDGRKIQLEKNRGEHFIHGASGNYGSKLFDTEIEEEKNRVTFSLTDTGEGGFGNIVRVRVSYTFDDDSRLGIHYEMIPEEDTILCPTNHAYFHLAGEEEITEHGLRVYAGNYAPPGDEGMPDGKVSPVRETPLDFGEEKRIGEAISDAPEGFFRMAPGEFDHCFLLDEKGFGLAAELISKKSGRRMRVYTDMPALILFTPAAKRPPQKGYFAVCLETQFVPNAVNCPQFDSPIVRKGGRLISDTVYEFGVQEDTDGGSN